MENSWVVFDCNTLRSHGVEVNNYMNRKNYRALIPDILIYESAAVADPKETFQKNFEHISKFNNNCELSYDIGEIMHQEKESGIPCTNPIATDLSTNFKFILQSIRNPGSEFDEFIGRLGDIGAKEKLVREKVGRAKKRLLNMIQAINEDFSEIDRKNLRRYGKAEIIRTISSASAQNTIYGLLERLGYSKDVRISLCYGWSVTFIPDTPNGTEIFEEICCKKPYFHLYYCQ